MGSSMHSVSSSMNEEPPRPDWDMAAQVYCATVIANLEGWRGETLPSTKEGRRLTIDQLEARIRHLESIDGIDPPPPMDVQSWDSLIYRAARLHRHMPQGPLISIYKQMTRPLPIAPTVGLLRRAVTVLGGVGPQSWTAFIGGDEDIDDDDLLQAAAQFLCYLVGKQSCKLVGSFKLELNCALALDMSLDAETNTGLYGERSSYSGSNDGVRPRSRLGPEVASQASLVPCHNSEGVTSPKPEASRWMRVEQDRERPAGCCGLRAWIFGALHRKFESSSSRRRRCNATGRGLGSDFSSSSL
ncbi:hypothetical protein F4861DRAFT_509936 [Xylaria intraflava]|nr:hypothetical protein F4861DRAFT_509936 [Xylaria intraflava]